MFNTRPATADSFDNNSGSRDSGAVMMACVSALRQPQAC
jgi:hypothetical protein